MSRIVRLGKTKYLTFEEEYPANYVLPKTRGSQIKKIGKATKSHAKFVTRTKTTKAR